MTSSERMELVVAQLENAHTRLDTLMQELQLNRQRQELLSKTISDVYPEKKNGVTEWMKIIMTAVLVIMISMGGAYFAWNNRLVLMEERQSYVLRTVAELLAHHTEDAKYRSELIKILDELRSKDNAIQWRLEYLERKMGEKQPLP